MPDTRFCLRLARTLCLLSATIFTLTACDTLFGSDRAYDNTAMIYSPNGEPLNGGPLGKPTCSDALSRWFDRADADHDGKLTRAEFRANAKAAFVRMDIDHNGFLLPEELERYRLPFRQEDIASHHADADDEKPRHRRRGLGFGDDSPPSVSPSRGPRAQPDPVMAADLNSDFKVTPQEFDARTENAFDRLELNHTGALDRDALLKFCPPPDRGGWF